MTSATVALTEQTRQARLPRVSGKELSRLLEVAAGINELLDLEEILHEVVGAARSLIGTDMATVLILEREGEYLRVAAADGVDTDLAERLSSRIDESLAGVVAKTARPIRSSDVASDRRSVLFGSPEAGISSTMIAPMIHRGEVIGVVGVETHAPRCFTLREQGILELLANQAATAIEKARLYAVEHDHVQQLERLLQKVNRQNDVMRQRREAHDRLAAVALENLGLQELADALVELVRAPLVLVNQFGVRLCGAEPLGGDTLEPLWRACAEDPRFEQQLKQLRGNLGLSQPAFVGDRGFWRLVRVVAAGEALGFIVALDHSQLGETEIAVLEEAASIVAAELLRERSIAEAEARLHGDVLRSLIVGDAGSAVRERAALLGYDLSSPQCVVAVRRTSGNPLELSTVMSCGAAADGTSGLRSLFGMLDQSCAVLLSAGDRALARETIGAWLDDFRERMARGGEQTELVCGVSRITAEASDIKSAYGRASQAATVGELTATPGVTFFDDVQLLAALASAANREQLSEFVDGTIGSLLRYDEHKGSDLAHTLEVYLDCSCVTRHAAKALYLHPHSLRYRLRRIGEIQGLSLDDPMARLTANLALKVRPLVASGGSEAKSA